MPSNKRSRTGYERRKDRKRSQILTAAIDLFKERGFRDVSVAHVAECAGSSEAAAHAGPGAREREVSGRLPGLPRLAHAAPDCRRFSDGGSRHPQGGAQQQVWSASHACPFVTGPLRSARVV